MFGVLARSLPRALVRSSGGRCFVPFALYRPSEPSFARPIHDGPPKSEKLTLPKAEKLPPPKSEELTPPKSEELTPVEKLKRAAKEYGPVLVAFHVGISLVSLGTMYMFVSVGVDTQQWIEWLGASDENSRIVAGASHFIVAYAIHKSLAPVRISITLVSVPLIVRYLRAKGFMKGKGKSK